MRRKVNIILAAGAALFIAFNLFAYDYVEEAKKAKGVEVDMKRFSPKDYPGTKSKTRKRIFLNGLWEFEPLKTEVVDKTAPPASDKFQNRVAVPSVWKPRGRGYSPAEVFRGPKEWNDIHYVWYRRTFPSPSFQNNEKVVLHFQSVSQYCRIFVNGKLVGENLGGYAPFYFDITDTLKPDGEENILSVYVQDGSAVNLTDNNVTYWKTLPPYFPPWVKGGAVNTIPAGIRGDVYLVVQPDIHIEDAFVIPSVRKKELTVKYEIAGEKRFTGEIEVKIETLKGKIVKNLGSRSVNITNPGDIAKVTVEGSWTNPKLWSPDKPHLYYCHTVLKDRNGKLVDENYTRFGFREFWVDGKEFVLNGIPVKLRGHWGNLNHVFANLSHWRPEYVRELLQQMKKDNFMGGRLDGFHIFENLFEIADEIGLPVTATGFVDCFIDIHPDAMPNALLNWKRIVRRARNHPSVIMWSIENEGGVHISGNDLRKKHYIQFQDMLKEEDSSKPFMHDTLANYQLDSQIDKYMRLIDLNGLCPVAASHYAYARRCFSFRMNHFPQMWLKRRDKPLVMGEYFCDPWTGYDYVSRYMADTVYDSQDARAELAGSLLFRMTTAWRAWEINGLNPNSIYSYTRDFANNFSPAARKQGLKFKYDSMEGPYAKPIVYPCNSKTLYGHMKSFDPWEPGYEASRRHKIFAPYFQRSFKPVIISMSRDLGHNFWSGSKLVKNVDIVNDSMKKAELRWSWTLTDEEGSVIASGKQESLSMETNKVAVVKVETNLPEVKKRTELMLKTELFQDGKKIAFDEMEVDLFPRIKVASKDVLVGFYGERDIYKTLKEWGFNVTRIKVDKNINLSKYDTVVIGPEELAVFFAETGDLNKGITLFNQYVQDGGHLLLLEQILTRDVETSFAHVKAPKHPFFENVDMRLSFWPAGYGEVSKGFMSIPITADARSLVLVSAHNHIAQKIGSALIEIRSGKGLLVATTLQIGSNIKVDPEAATILCNMLNSLSSPTVEPRKVACFGVDNSDMKFLKSVFDGSIDVCSVAKLADSLKNLNILIVGDGAGKALKKHAGIIQQWVKNGGIFLAMPMKNMRWAKPWLLKKIKTTALTKVRMLRKNQDLPIVAGMEYVLASSSNIKEASWQAKRGWKNISVPLYGMSDFGADWKILYAPHVSKQREAVLIARVEGKGMYIISQIPAESSMPTMKEAYSAILANLNVKTEKNNAFSSYLKLAGIDASLKIKVAPVKFADCPGFFPVNLMPYANRAFVENSKMGDKEGGWSDDGPGNDMRNFPTGDLLFGKTPFSVLNPPPNMVKAWGMNTCLVLGGKNRQYFPMKIGDIRVGLKANKLHFLQASTHTSSAPGILLGNYIIKYADGTESVVEIKNKVNITDWWRAVRTGDLPEGKLAWLGENVSGNKIGVYHMTWKNPYPNKQIATVDFTSTGKAVPVLIAITGEK